MKTEEDEAFDEIARKQGMWGGGFMAKRAMTVDKLQEDRIKYGTSWEQDGERIDPMSVYKEPVTEREALKLALEALESQIAYVYDTESNAYKKCFPVITAIKEALAQPVQEPVALVIDGVLVKSALPEKYTGHLYTAPPQREWVELTDEEIDEGNKQSWVNKQAWESAVWWASEKLKERNHGT